MLSLTVRIVRIVAWRIDSSRVRKMTAFPVSRNFGTFMYVHALFRLAVTDYLVDDIFLWN